MNRVSAQNSRNKSQAKMQQMEAELQRLKTHAKTLEVKNAQLVMENQRLSDLNQETTAVIRCQEADGSFVVRQPPESAELTYVPQQQEQGCPLAAGPPNLIASLTASTLRTLQRVFPAPLTWVWMNIRRFKKPSLPFSMLLGTKRLEVFKRRSQGVARSRNETFRLHKQQP